MDMYTLLYLKQITSKGLQYNTWNSAQCYTAVWMRGEFRGNGCMYMHGWVPSLFSWNYQSTVNKLLLLFSRSVMSDSLWLRALQWARLPCPSPSSGASSNSCPLSQWCYPTISSPVVPFSSSLQFFQASGSILMSRLFASGGQSIGASASASVLPMNIQDWFPLGLTGLISLKSKGLSKVFSNTTVQKHQFFGTQLSLWSNSCIHTWLLEKP